jgi:hypothetical protein
MGTEERTEEFAGGAGGSRKIIHIDMDAFYSTRFAVPPRCNGEWPTASRRFPSSGG